jgi:preprotein translocase subunit SecB
MTENIIQNQIRLTAFKAIRVNFSCAQKNAPAIKDEGPFIVTTSHFNLDLENLVFTDNPNGFIKVFKVQIQVNLEYDVVDFDVEFHTVFECDKPVDDKFLNSDFARISAPAIGFPFLRAFMSTISIQAGIQAIILPAINFIQWNKEKGVTPPARKKE